MKLPKYTSISLGIVVLLIIGSGIYFVGMFSATYPPLQEYYLDFQIKHFEQKLKKLDETQQFEIIITDTTGQYPSNYSVYFKILEKNNIEYHLKYSLDKSIINGESVELDLLAAYDKNKNQGGNRESDSEIIKSLIKDFEIEILEKIKN